MKTIATEEQRKLGEAAFFSDRDFLFYINGDDDFSLGGYQIASVTDNPKRRELSVIVRDTYRSTILEEELDGLLKKPWYKFGQNTGKELQAKLYKLTPQLETVYSVTYGKCRLTDYSMTDYNYSSKGLHGFRLTVKYGKKSYEWHKKEFPESELSEWKTGQLDDTMLIHPNKKRQKLTDKEKRILKYSNQMIERCIDDVTEQVKSDRIRKVDGEESIRQLRQAIKENDMIAEMHGEKNVSGK